MSFVFVLALLTVLGHACELPIGMAVAAHAHEGAHDSSDHHGDDARFECDPVLGVLGSAHALYSPDVDLYARVQPLVRTVAPHVADRVSDLHAPHERPPLFLLHAALLI